jgi:AcrR family transcriptional regulator
MKKTAKKRPDTRGRILLAAYEEFYCHGFQGGSINRIIEKAGSTKGAFFHHFQGKQALGYAVVEEVLHPQLKESWLDRLAGSMDPIADFKILYRKAMNGEIEGMLILQGCPINNLAQEMSALDEGFRKRIERIYDDWRGALAAALARGIKAGKVKRDVAPDNVALFVIAAHTGIIGAAKNSNNVELMKKAGEALFAYLDTLAS